MRSPQGLATNKRCVSARELSAESTTRVVIHLKHSGGLEIGVIDSASSAGGGASPVGVFDIWVYLIMLRRISMYLDIFRHCSTYVRLC